MTRKLGFKPLLIAFYNRLDTHALTLAYRVYNKGNVPDDATWPYIAFGTPLGKIDDIFTTRDTYSEDNVVLVDVWSDYAGDEEITEMMDNIVQAITSSSLSITGYDDPYLAFLDYADVIDDATESGRLVKHGLLRFRFHMAPSD